MQGQGTFFDPRLDRADQYPLGAKNHMGHLRHNPDLVTGKLAAMQFYQLALPPPTPPAKSFDKDAAARGHAVFDGKATIRSGAISSSTSNPCKRNQEK